MSDIEVEVTVPATEEPVEEISDALDHVVDVTLAEKVGFLEAKCAELEGKIDSHSHPENSHDHTYIETQVASIEDKIDSHIDSVEEEVAEEVEPVTVDEVESESESEEESSSDEPPKSRRERKSIADMYYGR